MDVRTDEFRPPDFNRFRRDVLAALEEDAVFDLEGALIAFDRAIEQVVNAVVAMTFGRDWHGRMELWTRDRIKHMAELTYTPADDPPQDPLAASVGGFAEISGSAAQAAAMVPDTLPRAPGSGLRIIDTREDRSLDHVQPLPSLTMQGGKPDPEGEAA